MPKPCCFYRLQLLRMTAHTAGWPVSRLSAAGILLATLSTLLLVLHRFFIMPYIGSFTSRLGTEASYTLAHPDAGHLYFETTVLGIIMLLLSTIAEYAMYLSGPCYRALMHQNGPWAAMRCRKVAPPETSICQLSLLMWRTS